MTQHQKILRYLDQHPEGITPMDAFRIGITKLATRISELIRMGFDIEKIHDTWTNAEGETSRFMRYRKAA